MRRQQHGGDAVTTKADYRTSAHDPLADKREELAHGLEAAAARFRAIQELEVSHATSSPLMLEPPPVLGLDFERLDGPGLDALHDELARWLPNAVRAQNYQLLRAQQSSSRQAGADARVLRPGDHSVPIQYVLAESVPYATVLALGFTTAMQIVFFAAGSVGARAFSVVALIAAAVALAYGWWKTRPLGKCEQGLLIAERPLEILRLDDDSDELRSRVIEGTIFYDPDTRRTYETFDFVCNPTPSRSGEGWDSTLTRTGRRRTMFLLLCIAVAIAVQIWGPAWAFRTPYQPRMVGVGFVVGEFPS